MMLMVELCLTHRSLAGQSQGTRKRVLTPTLAGDGHAPACAKGAIGDF